MAKTLAQLRTSARGISNTESSTGFITDAWLNERINEALRELYDLVLGKFQHYYVSTSSFTLTGSDAGSTTTLPSDFYKDIGLDKWPGTPKKRNIPRLGSFADRHNPPEAEYMIRGTGSSGLLAVAPTVSSAGDYLLYYVPDAPQLAADGDTLDATMGKWPLFIELHVAIAVKDKREMDTTSLEARLGRERARIESIAAYRSEQPAQAARPKRRSPFDFDDNC